MAIPREISEQLCAGGGVDGLLRQIPSNEDLSFQARFHHALSDPVRLKILYALQAQPLCVCVIKELISIADSRLSYHLNVLKTAGLISGAQQGNWIIYTITDFGRSGLR
jgi:ArsR family transcriptional regulator